MNDDDFTFTVKNKRCTLCNLTDDGKLFEETWMPGTGFRCADHDACWLRVRAIIDGHQKFAKACEDDQ